MGRGRNHGFHSICALHTGKREFEGINQQQLASAKTLFPTGMAPMERKLFVTGPRLAIPMFMYRRTLCGRPATTVGADPPSMNRQVFTLVRCLHYLWDCGLPIRP